MPNGRNSGRLYPGQPGDVEVVVWDDQFGATMAWKLERTAIAPLTFLGSKTEARAEAEEHGIEFYVGRWNGGHWEQDHD
jgi:hypothetical protein